MNKYRNIVARMGGALLLAGAFVAVTPAQADAALMVWVCNDFACSGGGDTVITDNVGSDLDGETGSILANLGGGQIETAFTTHPDDASRAYLNVTYRFTNDFATAGPFIYAAQDGWSPAATNFNFEADASDGDGDAAAYVGAGAFAPGGQVFFGDGAAYGPADMDFEVGFGVPGSDPYTIAIGIQATASGDGIASGDATLSSVPEPASLALFGLGLFGVGVMSRRRAAR